MQKTPLMLQVERVTGRSIENLLRHDYFYDNRPAEEIQEHLGIKFHLIFNFRPIGQAPQTPLKI